MSAHSSDTPLFDQLDEPPPVEYREIPGFPGYRIGNDGSAWTCRVSSRMGGVRFSERWKRLRFCGDRKGYLWLRIKQGGLIILSRRIHGLVLELFVCPRPPDLQCRHLDGNPKNNVLSNLRWGTGSENQDDFRRHLQERGLKRTGCNQGEKNSQAKLSLENVAEIRRLRTEGVPVKEIAVRFNVHWRHIYRILAGVKWKS